MSNLNKVILIGRLTRDPIIRHTPKGSNLTEFSLAVNRTYTSESGDKREETTFVDIIFWGKTAELIGKYLNKGNLACIEGRLKMESWPDKTSGQQRSKLLVVGESIQFLETSRSSPRDKQVDDWSQAPALSRTNSPVSGLSHENDDDDRVPF